MSEKTSSHFNCRFCKAPLTVSFADLGSSPLCQKHVLIDRQREAEPNFTLHAFVCTECYLVQLDEFVSPEVIFGDGEYAYFSSYSTSWLEHAKRYTDMMTQRFDLGAEDLVVELASNDGYLLQYFKEKNIPVLGIEPASNCAAAAREKGIETVVRFFGEDTAKDVKKEKGGASLLLGNNVLAHVPDINDFVKGMKELLAPDGIITMEFPHLLRLVEENQFDTIYHEHFSYLSFSTVSRIFEHFGLSMFDVQELPTHGGSIRIFARHTGHAEAKPSERVTEMLQREKDLGMLDLPYYRAFNERVKETKRKLLSFLIEQKRAGKQIVGYGAPGKGNTLLNYCGIGTDFLDYTVDRNPHKAGNLLPGSRIPIEFPEKIMETKPDFILILPWNLKKEISEQMKAVREWGCKFVVPIPEVQTF